MLRVLDFLIAPVTVYAMMTWCDPVGHHHWYLGAMIIACNLIGYFRGMDAGSKL